MTTLNIANTLIVPITYLLKCHFHWQDYAFPQVFDREYLKTFYARSREKGFDVERYNQLSDHLAELQSDLRRLRDPLHLGLPLQQTEMLVQDSPATNKQP